MNYDKYLRLTGKKLLGIIGAEALFLFLHNAVYTLFYDYFRRTNSDEPFFFFLALVIIPLYFMVTVIYTVLRAFMTNLPFTKK